MKVSGLRYLIDAGPLVAALSDRDQWHQWAVQAMGVIDEPVGTSEFCLAEACHHLKFDRAGLRRLVSFVASGRLVPLSAWPWAPRVNELLAKYPHMDAGDASLVVLSEQHTRARIVTTDVRTSPCIAVSVTIHCPSSTRNRAAPISPARRDSTISPPASANASADASSIAALLLRPAPASKSASAKIVRRGFTPPESGESGE